MGGSPAFQSQSSSVRSFTAMKGRTGPSPSCRRRLLAIETDFSKTCGAMIEEPTDRNTPPSIRETPSAKTWKSIIPPRPYPAPPARGWV